MHWNRGVAMMDFKDEAIEGEIVKCLREVEHSVSNQGKDFRLDEERSWLAAVPVFLEKLEYALAIEELIAIGNETKIKFELKMSRSFWERLLQIAKKLMLDKSIANIEANLN